MIKAKPIHLPNFKKTFMIFTDACDTGIAWVLTQKENGRVLPISWISIRLNVAERNYFTTEKELLGIVWTVEKYNFYISQRLLVKTDNKALKWLISKEFTTQRLI